MNESKKHSVLIVDDENSEILTLTYILSQDYTVYAAKSGQGAISAAEKHLPDVILLDIIMPEMDGYAVFNELRKSEKTKDIPIIFITALSSADYEEKGLALGTSDYITKPFTPAIVKLRVQNQMKLLEQSRANEYDIMKYKLSNDALKIGLWDMDVVESEPLSPDNRHTWSKEFRNLLGLSDEDRLTNTIQDFADMLHPEDSEMAMAAFAAHFNDHSGKTPYDIECRLRMKNGEYRFFQTLGTTQRDSNGVPVRVAGAVRDITEKKQMEETISRRETMLDALNKTAIKLLSQDEEKFEDMMSSGIRQIVELFEIDRFSIFRNLSMPDGLHASQVYRWDKESGGTTKPTPFYTDIRYAEFAPNWEHILGSGNAVNGPVRLMPEKEAAALKEAGVISAFIVPVSIDNEFWGFALYEDRRSERHFDGNYTEIMRSAAFLCASAVVRNTMLAKIRENYDQKRRAEVAEESNKAKSQFLANMSHEMRTPMNVVVGLTDLILEEDDLAFNLKENIKKIRTAGNTLLGLINDLLDISKIEAGKLELLPVRYEVPSLLNDIISLNMIRIEDKPIKFLLDINGDLPDSLYGDDLRVKQIINNVLSNAFKYTKEGTVTLGMSCLPDHCEPPLANGGAGERGHVWVSIYVRDTGIGIHEEDMKNLFTDYHQADARTNRMIEGTGLGLSITKRLVEFMDGEISAESEYGKGSTFRIRIRQGFVSDKTIGDESAERLCGFRYTENKSIASKKFVRPDLNFAKVLVVDDMQTNLDVAAGLLRKYKMQVDCVLSGQEAVELIRAGEPVYNAIFMDHMMPGMDGIETASVIRNLESAYAREIPIIALTANAIQGTENLFYANGFQAFVPKPIDIMQLDSVIRKWIHRE